MKFNEDLRRDFVEAVKYAMRLLLTEFSSFTSNMTITDTFLTCFTDSLVSKGRIRTSIAAHVRRKVVEEIGKMKTDVMEAQQWKAETATDKLQDAKRKKKIEIDQAQPPSWLGRL